MASHMTIEPLSVRLPRTLRRFKPTETQILVAMGVLVGLGAGLGAVAFRYLINGFMYVFFDVIGPALTPILGPAAVVPLPALGGLIVGPLIYFFAREAKGHGVPEVMLAVAQRGGRIRPAVVVVKALASAVTIGSGGSVGREGPIVQIGSALGSTLGQVLRMSDDRIRTLVACGAAGGIAATFNAPIAGVFFALEVILGEFTTRAFGIVVISSVTASVVGRTAFGDVPAFPVPAFEVVSVGEFGLYAVLAVIAGAVGVGFTRTLYAFEDWFDAIPMPEYLKPVPGGLALGLLGMFLPQVFGVGYPAMDSALHGDYGLLLLVILVVAKVVAVSVTIGSGGSGGVFAPSLFIGAMLGTAFGTAANLVWPGAIGPAGAYGLVGMGAVFAGAARAPITSVIILFELTGDYRIILPLMLAVVLEHAGVRSPEPGHDLHAQAAPPGHRSARRPRYRPDAVRARRPGDDHSVCDGFGGVVCCRSSRAARTEWRPRPYPARRSRCSGRHRHLEGRRSGADRQQSRPDPGPRGESAGGDGVRRRVTE